jgi:chitodextrinase
MDADALTSGTVKLPGIGPVKKVYVYVGVGVIGVAVAYLMYSRQQAAEEEYVEPSEAELGDGLTTGVGSDSYTNPAPSNTGSYNDDVPAPARTNIEWTERAIERFSSYEESYVLAVLTKYLNRQKLTTEEGDFVRQVWALLGKPPEGPSSFTLISDGPAPGTSTAPGTPGGLKVTSTSTNSIGLDWNDVTGASGYEVYRGGSKVADTTGSSYTSSGLAANTSYEFYVKAKSSAGMVSAGSSKVTGKTKAATTTAPKPSTPAKPAPKPATPTYVTVTVAKYTTKNPPWNSTISGIAAKYGTTTSAVWNDPKNAGIKRARRDPKLIRPGDKIYVKKK